MQQTHKGTQHYLVDEKGSIRFTRSGKALFKPYFAKAGIALSAIKTKDDFIAARRETSHQFGELLERMVDQHGDDSPVGQLITAIVSGDFEKADQLEKQWEGKDKGE